MTNDYQGFTPEAIVDSGIKIVDDDTQIDRSLPRELKSLLNQFSAESVSGTPDFILSEFLLDSIKAFNAATVKRADWRGESVELPALQRLHALGVEPDSEPSTLGFLIDKLLINLADSRTNIIEKFMSDPRVITDSARDVIVEFSDIDVSISDSDDILRESNEFALIIKQKVRFRNRKVIDDAGIELGGNSGGEAQKD